MCPGCAGRVLRSGDSEGQGKREATIRNQNAK